MKRRTKADEEPAKDSILHSAVIIGCARPERAHVAPRPRCRQICVLERRRSGYHISGEPKC